jgi:hypothetical protein
MLRRVVIVVSLYGLLLLFVVLWPSALDGASCPPNAAFVGAGEDGALFLCPSATNGTVHVGGILENQATDAAISSLRSELAAATTRAADGLALSSRNGYLSADERAEAVHLSLALNALAASARAAQATGRMDVAAAENQAMDYLRARGWQPDYVTLRHQHDLSPVSSPDHEPMVVLGAAKLGRTRLIDNTEV